MNDLPGTQLGLFHRIERNTDLTLALLISLCSTTEQRSLIPVVKDMSVIVCGSIVKLKLINKVYRS